MSTQRDQDSHLVAEPLDMGNRDYLETRLNELEDKYSPDELSGLPTYLLEKEEENLEFDFLSLKRQFPQKEYSHEKSYLHKIQKGDNYRGLTTLTTDQLRLIRDTKARLRRNIGREYTKAREREQSQRLITRFSSWLNEFVDNATPLLTVNL